MERINKNPVKKNTHTHSYTNQMRLIFYINLQKYAHHIHWILFGVCVCFFSVRVAAGILMSNSNHFGMKTWLQPRYQIWMGFFFFAFRSDRILHSFHFQMFFFLNFCNKCFFSIFCKFVLTNKKLLFSTHLQWFKKALLPAMGQVEL